jgi:hypothetical protein
MKLFKYEPQYEGQCSVSDAIICFGKKIEGDGLHNGWYIILNLPFVKKHIPNYLDPRTFTYHPEDCFRRYAAACRRLNGNGKYIFYHTHMWAPVELLQER